MDGVAERLLCGDALERAMWSAVLVRASELAFERDQRLAQLIAASLVGE